MTDDRPSFPRAYARTQRFTLGVPRQLAVSQDGSRVAFVRSAAGTDPVGRLWVLDVATMTEHLLVDPPALLGGGDERLSAEERSRRERMRESASGVVAYSADAGLRRFALSLSGHLVGVDAGDPAAPVVTVLGAAEPVVDPRVDPSGRRIGYVSARSLRVVGVDGSDDRALLVPDTDSETVGLADFVAAEELERSRGFWWSPDGSRLLVERYDDSPVARWYVGDPADPAQPPAEQRYPAAGTANALVSLWLVDLAGAARQVAWDQARFPYLVSVDWSDRGDPLVHLLSRRQDRSLTLGVDPETGATRTVLEQASTTWLDVTPGAPTWAADGRLLTIDAGDCYRLCADGTPLTPAGLQVRGVVSVDHDGALVVAHDDPAERHVWRVDGTGARPLTTAPGVHAARAGGGTVVTTSATLVDDGPVTRVTAADGRRHEVASLRAEAGLTPRPVLARVGERAIPTALLLPTGWREGSGRLPVLMDPYGGPHGPRVVASRGAHLAGQWLADQGFAVVVADGRGTPGDPAWERAVWHDLATPVLDDQVAALHAVAERHPDLDLSRVAIRGWSFGGYLAALAVLRRPDVFHAAVAGAPVSDWRLYDTAYTERYLGLPDEDPDAYEACSLLPLAGRLTRPLLLVHGLADDNVVVAHTLRLSAALLAAGRPHQVLPLSGVTHMTPQEAVAENLLLLQLAFLRQALGMDP